MAEPQRDGIGIQEIDVGVTGSHQPNPLIDSNPNVGAPSSSLQGQVDEGARADDNSNTGPPPRPPDISATKTRRVRHNWKSSQDLALVNRVHAAQPWTAAHGQVLKCWNEIKHDLEQGVEFVGVELTPKGCRDRMKVLQERLKKLDELVDHRSGRSENFSELEQALIDIREAEKDAESQKSEQKKARNKNEEAKEAEEHEVEELTGKSPDKQRERLTSKADPSSTIKGMTGPTSVDMSSLDISSDDNCSVLSSPDLSLMESNGKRKRKGKTRAAGSAVLLRALEDRPAQCRAGMAKAKEEYWLFKQKRLEAELSLMRDSLELDMVKWREEYDLRKFECDLRRDEHNFLVKKFEYEHEFVLKKFKSEEQERRREAELRSVKEERDANIANSLVMVLGRLADELRK
ncbi:unnamed protein product [Discosporangium mesarthrocarpum]